MGLALKPFVSPAALAPRPGGLARRVPSPVGCPEALRQLAAERPPPQEAVAAWVPQLVRRALSARVRLDAEPFRARGWHSARCEHRCRGQPPSLAEKGSSNGQFSCAGMRRRGRRLRMCPQAGMGQRVFERRHRPDGMQGILPETHRTKGWGYRYLTAEAVFYCARIVADEAAPAPPMAGARRVLIKPMNLRTPTLPAAA